MRRRSLPGRENERLHVVGERVYTRLSDAGLRLASLYAVRYVGSILARNWSGNAKVRRSF